MVIRGENIVREYFFLKNLPEPLEICSNDIENYTCKLFFRLIYILRLHIDIEIELIETVAQSMWPCSCQDNFDDAPQQFEEGTGVDPCHE